MTIPRNLSNLAPGASAGGVLGASYGGTGSTTLTANNVLLGNGTSALQVVAPGTSGNALISNGTTWASSTVPGGWVYLSTVTASAAATADIETTFDSTYDNYVIVASGVYSSAASYMVSRFKIGGTYSPASLYNYSNMYNSSTTVSGAFAIGSTGSSIFMPINSPTQSTSSAVTMNFLYYVYNPASSSINKMVSFIGQGSISASQLINFNGSGNYASTTPLTGIRFLWSSGTITGTFRLYGIKNS